MKTMKKRKFLLITLVILIFTCMTVQADDGFSISRIKDDSTELNEQVNNGRTNYIFSANYK